MKETEALTAVIDEIPTLDDVKRAGQRISSYIRRTPLIPAVPAKTPIHEAGRLSLKLECLQIVGSFKARGASAKLTSLDDTAVARGLVTASGGNHGLGVAYAGWRAGAPAKVFLPTTTPSAKAEKIAAWGAEVVHHGSVWDEANEAALAAAESDGLTYVHPFADPAVIAGQGTVALEILEQAADADVLLVAIGGGGLIAGIATVAKALKPEIRIIGIEATGAPTLKRSVEAGGLVTLDEILTEAGTLAPRRSEVINLQIIAEHVAEIVLVTDEEMRQAARWLWFEFGIAAELSGAAAVAALQAGAYRPADGAHVVALVCGAGTDGIV
jgi:threonine dehydratase